MKFPLVDIVFNESMVVVDVKSEGVVPYPTITCTENGKGDRREGKGTWGASPKRLRHITQHEP